MLTLEDEGAVDWRRGRGTAGATSGVGERGGVRLRGAGIWLTSAAVEGPGDLRGMVIVKGGSSSSVGEAGKEKVDDCRRGAIAMGGGALRRSLPDPGEYADL